MAHKADGKIIRSIGDVAAGDTIHLTLEDGQVQATVNRLEERKV